MIEKLKDIFKRLLTVQHEHNLLDECIYLSQVNENVIKLFQTDDDSELWKQR